jgi:hypothetical protein
MRYGAFAVVMLAAACQANELPFTDEIYVVRSDVKMLENEVAQESPLWQDDFNRVMDDDSTHVPEAVYRHVVRKIWKMTDEQISELAQTGIKVKAVKERPSEYRGKFLRVTGRVSKVWPENVNFGGYPQRQVVAGMAYANDIEPFLFHVLVPPGPLYAKEDVIGIDGLFLKVITFDLANGGQLRAPFLVGRAVRKYH